MKTSGYGPGVDAILRGDQERAMKAAGQPTGKVIRARDVTAALRNVVPAPVLLSVRADPEHYGEFDVRLPEAAHNHLGGAWAVATFAGRELGVDFGVDGVRWARRRDCGLTAVTRLHLRRTAEAGS